MIPMIQLTGDQMALLSAAFARVSSSEQHKWKGDKGLNEIAEALKAEVSVYDVGPRDEKIRHLRFDFETGSIEFEIGPQPELVRVDNRPDDDPTPPGTPIAATA